jgi:hypothetical protein
MATYYVRHDGSAANKAAATGPASTASACMSLKTFNGETFSAGDTVIFSSRGGNFTALCVIPSSGSSGSPIVYRGEDGYTPLFVGTGSEGAVQVNSIDYIELRDLKAGVNTSPFYFSGTSSNVITYNLEVVSSGNQGLQHLNTVSVTHYNLVIANCGDEGISCHDTPTVVIHGATITDCDNGMNWVGAPTLTVEDCEISGISASGRTIQYSGTGGTHIFRRCYIVEHVDQAGRVTDCLYGSWTWENCIFKNLTDGDYYMLARNTVSAFSIYNCTFMGDGVNTCTAIFNSYSGFVAKNNIFVACGTQALYGTTGTIDYNLFYNSGTARGSHTVTSDPGLSATGRISTGSSAIDAGIGPGSDAAVPTTDIDGDTRSGTTCDLGADEMASYSTTIEMPVFQLTI